MGVPPRPDTGGFAPNLGTGGTFKTGVDCPLEAANDRVGMMNHRIGIIACLLGLVGAGGVRGHQAASPDGRLVVRVKLREGAPMWSVWRDQKPLLRQGTLGMEIEGREAGAVEEVSWTGSEHREEVATAFEGASILFPSEDEAGWLAGVDDPTAAAERLLDLSETVVVTCGADGAVIARQGVPTFHIPAAPTDLVNTLGCGDAFAGGGSSIRDQDHSGDLGPALFLDRESQRTRDVCGAPVRLVPDRQGRSEWAGAYRIGSTIRGIHGCRCRRWCRWSGGRFTRGGLTALCDVERVQRQRGERIGNDMVVAFQFREKPGVRLR